MNGVATILLGTAALKAALFLQLPLDASRPDAVIGFLTKREVLVLAALFEVEIARSLFASGSGRKSGLYLLWFCTAASVYQVGLMATGQDGCSCLGVLSREAVSPELSRWLPKLLLLVLWISAGRLLVSGSRSALWLKKPSAR